LTKRAQSPGRDESTGRLQVIAAVEFISDFNNTSLQSSAHNGRENGQSRLLLLLSAARACGPMEEVIVSNALSPRFGQTLRGASISVQHFTGMCLYFHIHVNAIACGGDPASIRSFNFLPEALLLAMQDLLTHLWK
jgi:hypothetical protein